MFLPKLQFATVSIAFHALFAWSPGISNAQNLPTGPSRQALAAGATRAGAPVTLNFVNAEVDAVARTMAVITGRNVVVDPRVKGTITLVTTTPVTPTQALRQFSIQLRTQGLALVESSGLYLVVPEADAKLQSGAVSAGAVPAASGQIITQIFRLNHETANNLVPVLRPLISPNNTINVNPGNNSLIVTDYADNLQRIGTIIAALDVANATGVEIIRLQYAIATDLAPLVTRLIESGSSAAGGSGQADTAFKTTLVAEPRSNSLILRAANPARLALVRTLVEKLDQGAFNGAASANGSGGKESATGNIYVVYLKNADATKLATTLRAALAANSASGATASGLSSSSSTLATTANAGSSGGNTAATGSLSVSQPSTGGQIQADPATNSLIITAPEPQYRQLRAVIDKLDARRAQVFVESLIAEVNADKAAEFGIQFQGALGKKGDNNIGLLGTNFSIGGTNIITLAKQAASGGAVPSPGGNFGIATKQGNGVYVLGFLARFLESSGEGNVLSTPNLLTLDNEEARIVVGRNVPFITGQYINNNTSMGSVNPFQTIERKDVGLTLRVKPQVSEDGSVKLQVFQEVSSVDPATVNSPNGPTTNKRSIESNVVVEDGAIVVLGGLLTDEYSGGQEKVPGLGDVPLFGNLFKGESRSRRKSNLMVFLRPVVVRDATATDNLSMDRYEFMRGAQKDNQPIPNVMVPVNGSAVLPPRPPYAPGAAPAIPPSLPLITSAPAN
ncbi:type II secretion system secretin GspD [Polaromonas sp. Pch-P]|uniref:type II secretion system secretin GspD n=2 Tax=unclassified Polaromonas TaxID=2638319 RepID=UPI000F097DDC|nr:type II secretion system secretin GspD [Polaromonas sp. Pch-P]AYQ30658.1 type II secretion system protein GspD [Polaromonas sp. SP1]QGJ20790.1 type II secretion system protein GspD [Polaromonas sp. Pch-P]